MMTIRTSVSVDARIWRLQNLRKVTQRAGLVLVIQSLLYIASGTDRFVTAIFKGRQAARGSNLNIQLRSPSYFLSVTICGNIC